MNKITIQVTLDQGQAWDLALLCKRFGYTNAADCSNPRDPEEPYRLMEALQLVERQLNNAGFSPR